MDKKQEKQEKQDLDNLSNRNKPPSYYALAITCILTATLVLIIAFNFKKLINPKERSYKTMIVIILLGIMIGVYGILHLGFDKIYKYPKKLFTKKLVFNHKNKQNQELTTKSKSHYPNRNNSQN